MIRQTDLTALRDELREYSEHGTIGNHGIRMVMTRWADRLTDLLGSLPPQENNEEHSICRLQLPDGTVPGNNVEALVGWKAAYDALFHSWATLKSDYDYCLKERAAARADANTQRERGKELDDAHKRTLRAFAAERTAADAARLELRKLKKPALGSIPPQEKGLWPELRDNGKPNRWHEYADDPETGGCLVCGWSEHVHVSDPDPALGSLPVPDTEALSSASRKLLSEVKALLGISEPSLRDLFGNTNINVLKLRADELSAVLSRPAQEPPKENV